MESEKRVEEKGGEEAPSSFLQTRLWFFLLFIGLNLMIGVMSYSSIMRKTREDMNTNPLFTIWGKLKAPGSPVSGSYKPTRTIPSNSDPAQGLKPGALPRLFGTKSYPMRKPQSAPTQTQPPTGLVKAADAQVKPVVIVPPESFEKPLIAVCVCTKVSNTDAPAVNTSLQVALINSMVTTVTQEELDKYTFQLHLGVDSGDWYWLKNARLLELPEWLTVHTHFSAKNGNHVPFNSVTLGAYDAGATYITRLNDDTTFQTSGWVTLAVNGLAKMDPPNVGVVGPKSIGDSQKIMTHDFTHRTHIEIFGFYYPVVFSAWFVDDFITKVYLPRRSKRIVEWVVLHGKLESTRYVVQQQEGKYLFRELGKGRRRIQDYLATGKKAVIIPHEELTS